LQVAASIGVAALSWRYIEEPIRHGALGRLWERIRSGTWRPRALPRQVRIAIGVAMATLLLASVGLAGAAPPTHMGFLTAQDSSADAQAALSGGTIVRTTTATTPTASTAPSHGTSCTRVVHIGDSTSEGLVSHSYLPKRADRIEARYAHQGVQEQHMEISGATSIVETLPGGTNAQDVARDLIDHGYHGCWVLALGTNDAADVYVGSSVALSTRIDRMMSVIGDQPVMWVNVKSLVGSGPYAESNMEQWNRDLEEACSKYPNMRIFDWAGAAKDSWYIPDGIHYTSPGYKARAQLIAKALAEAFPADGSESPKCVVQA
jgi:lysophospholipase L1-like esterase